VDVRVIAIAEDIGLLSKFNFFVPAQTLRTLYQLKGDMTGVLLINVKDMTKIPEDQAALRKALEQAGFQLLDPSSDPFWKKFDSVNREDWTGQKLDVTTWEDEVSFLTWILTALNGITGLLAVVLLVVISVGVMNAMWIAIRERTREIGTLRAIGMQRSRVLTMFLAEGFALAVAGTLAGGLIGVLVTAVVNAVQIPLPGVLEIFLMSHFLNMVVDPVKVAAALAVIIFFTSVVTLIPSFRAARMKPITAMHHIG
jgi:putative ABC transport system permease protein